MPLDGVTVSALRVELEEKITGGRIDKVQQPARDMLLLSLRSGGENLRLLLSAGVGSARAHLTRESFENPAEPPMFCMLLRKHLAGARILSVEQPELERMLLFRLDCRDELGMASQKTLVVEMIGRSSNIILAGEDGRIIDCIRRVDFGGDALRRMLPGMLYRLPPRQVKPAFFALDPEERTALVRNADREAPVDRWLLGSFSGLSPLLCRELAFRCGGDYARLPEQMEALAETVAAGDFAPWLLRQEGRPLDYSFMAITQYGSAAQAERMDSFSQMLDLFYADRDRLEQRRRRSRELSHTVKTARDRVQRKLAAQTEELRRTERMDEVRKTAELVTANLYRMKRGERTLRCQDYYEPDCPEITIPLDPLKTPQQNAAALYKEYNKLKGAKLHLTELTEQNRRQLDYLNSVLEEIDRAETEKDLADIRAELRATGVLRQKRETKPVKTRPQAPLRFVTGEGLELLVGRNNLQNEELTFKTARRTDYWFHVQHAHGSHVILRCDGLEPGEESVRQAAAAAAYYSQARGAGKVPVDYTMVRHVRKSPGALPGRVLYTEYKTVLAQGDEESFQNLRKI